MHVWKTGEPTRITYEGRTVAGRVILASGNGRSLMLEFEALLGGYAGTMPVLWDDTGATFRDLICGLAVTLDRLDPRS